MSKFLISTLSTVGTFFFLLNVVAVVFRVVFRKASEFDFPFQCADLSSQHIRLKYLTLSLC